MLKSQYLGSRRINSELEYNLFQIFYLPRYLLFILIVYVESSTDVMKSSRRLNKGMKKGQKKIEEKKETEIIFGWCRACTCDFVVCVCINAQRA